uniref:Uncharacterized protein n=1 Tax=Anguilla anguilla TaxID=7936 RepID=A0A0E9W4X4_ANGAN
MLNNCFLPFCLRTMPSLQLRTRQKDSDSDLFHTIIQKTRAITESYSCTL